MKVPGCMKLHAIGHSKNEMSWRTKETSCHCEICATGYFCDVWSTVRNRDVMRKQPENTKRDVNNNESTQTINIKQSPR